MIRTFCSEDIKRFVSRTCFDVKTIHRKDASWPRVGIVTPSYNQVDFLERTILSVLNQNYPNLDYVIIDGGSTDGSVDIIKKYEKYLAYWTSERDSGQAEALNKGISLLSGDWIGWQNSDDIYLPNALSSLAKNIRRYRGYKGYFASRLVIDSEDKVTHLNFCHRPDRNVYTYHGMMPVNQSLFLSRDAFYLVGRFDENLHYAFDHEYFLRLLNTGLKLKYCKGFWGALRHHDRSKTCMDGNKWGIEHERIYRAVSLPFGRRDRRIVRAAFRCLSRCYAILDNDFFPISYKVRKKAKEIATYRKSLVTGAT